MFFGSQTYWWYVTLIIVIVLMFLSTRKSSKVHNFEHQKHHKQRGSSCAFRGSKSKCFSCEKQAYKLSNGNECAVFNEHPMKYYETTQIYPAMGYAKMGPMA